MSRSACEESRPSDEEIFSVLDNVVSVLEDSAFKGVFVLADVHGMPYKGPYIELDKIKDVRARLGELL